ncbi:hypothetical protein MIZ03_1138 [Rhodoferax lithotrophicus]|uniref:Uncharacterized protein n=1 Tax=Rhodoferax lithotrophicus TaxID=2798804 RepID=A0ABM7MJ11_9BURK|nr:hypothetical protein MIZ03_1138 [Rhodoferax sp. MIZ03]
MKEFKCLGSPVEVTCHVPYPYQHPGKVSSIGLSRYPSNRRIPILSLSMVKKFLGTSENAVKTQIWCAIATYVLIAIVKKELQLKSALYICARQIGSQNNPDLLKLCKTALSLALARVEC